MSNTLLNGTNAKTIPPQVDDVRELLHNPTYLAGRYPNSVLLGGHSYIDPSSTPGVPIDAYSLDNQLKQMLHNPTTWTNLADTGAQLAVVGDSAGHVAFVQSAFGTSAYRTAFPYVTQQPASFLYWGINDAILAAGATSGVPIYSAFPHALRAVIAGLMTSSWFEYTNGAFAYAAGGGVTATDKNRGAGYRQFTTNGQTVTWTVPSDFEGGVLQLWFVGRGAGNGGTWNVTIDGAAVDSFTTDGQALAASQVISVRRYNVPAAGTHTVVATQSGTPTNFNWFNGAGIEARDVVPPIVVANVNRWPAYSGAWAGVTDAVVEKFNQSIDSVVNEFPSNVQVCDVDSVLNADPTLFHTDQGHMNLRGTTRVAAAMYQQYLKCVAATALEGKTQYH